MVWMALDHTRDFFTNVRFEPENINLTWPGLFFTRWITHFCAPMFFLLAGTGAFLYRHRAGSVGKVSRFLWTRGIWLVVLEWTIIEFAWTFVPWIFGGVIWSLGISMVILAALVWLPESAILTFGLVLVALHDLFDAVQPAQMGSLGGLWVLLHRRGVVPGTSFFVLFPLVPWVGVMACGYVLGRFMLGAPAVRQRILVFLGSTLTLAFVVLRGLNAYGNPQAGIAASSPGEWHALAAISMTSVYFFDLEKSPILAVLARDRWTFSPVALVFGPFWAQAAPKEVHGSPPDLRTRANVLLHTSSLRNSPAGNWHGVHLPPARELALARHFLDEPYSRGLRLRPLVCLRDVVHYRYDALLPLPLVRGLEAATKRGRIGCVLPSKLAPLHPSAVLIRRSHLCPARALFHDSHLAAVEGLRNHIRVFIRLRVHVGNGNNDHGSLRLGQCKNSRSHEQHRGKLQRPPKRRLGSVVSAERAAQAAVLRLWVNVEEMRRLQHRWRGTSSNSSFSTC